MSEKSVNSLLF